MPTMSASLGTKIRRLRKAAGLTQIQLAERAGVSQGSITAYETGQTEPLVSVAAALARALGVTVEQLLSDGPEDDT